MINEYGPTETVVGCSVYEVKRAGEGEGERGEEEEQVAIGRGIANTRVYVVDEGMEAVPVGVEGELYMGGAGVGRGYWRRGGMTAERFVPDRSERERGRGLYRTGDRVKWREDGSWSMWGGRTSR